jgi:hypothetical protein
MPDHKLVLVSAAQLVGGGRPTSFPGPSPVAAVLMRQFGDVTVSLHLAGVAILAAGLLAALIAATLIAQPKSR